MTTLRLIAFAALALAVTTSAHAMSPAPLHQSDGMITQVREACGAGDQMVNGRCGLLPPAAMPPGVRWEAFIGWALR